MITSIGEQFNDWSRIPVCFFVFPMTEMVEGMRRGYQNWTTTLAIVVHVLICTWMHFAELNIQGTVEKEIILKLLQILGAKTGNDGK